MRIQIDEHVGSYVFYCLCMGVGAYASAGQFDDYVFGVLVGSLITMLFPVVTRFSDWVVGK